MNVFPRNLLHTLASGLIAKAQGGSVAGGAAGGLTAGLMGYNDALSKVNGVEIDVIKKGNEITAGYPVGGKPTPGLTL